MENMEKENIENIENQVFGVTPDSTTVNSQMMGDPVTGTRATGAPPCLYLTPLPPPNLGSSDQFVKISFLIIRRQFRAFSRLVRPFETP